MEASYSTPLTSAEKRLLQRISQRVYQRYTPAGSDGRSLTREELFHYGVIGLLKARQKFVVGKGASWEVFAAFRIEGEMLDNLRKAPLVRLPQKVQDQVKALRQAVQRLEQENRPVNSAGLAAELGWDETEVEKTRAAVPTLVNLVDENSFDDEGQGTDGVVVADKDPDATPDNSLLRREMLVVLERCLSLLPEAGDRLIVKARKLEDVTLRELAESFSCSLESIRRREKAALIQLKGCLERHGWDAPL